MVQAPIQLRKKIILSLQTMRLFASLGVVQFHLWHNYLGVAVGHPGTDFFLVLVGMVAAFVHASRIPYTSWSAYILARYIRLYITYIPLFLIVLVTKWHETSWDWVLQSFFFFPIADRFPVIGATWMLSMFMLFYYVFSIAFVVQKESVLWPIFMLWTSGIVFFTWLDWQPALPAHWSQLFFNERNLDFIFGYLAGMILRENRATIYWGRWAFWTGFIGVIGGTIWLNSTVNDVGRSLFVGIPVAIFILGLASLEQQKAADLGVRILTKPWLVLLGETSYVLYLSHGIYLQVWSRVFPVTPALVPIITMGAILTGVIGYFFWEEPLLRHFKNKARTIQLPKLRRNKTGF